MIAKTVGLRVQRSSLLPKMIGRSLGRGNLVRMSAPHHPLQPFASVDGDGGAYPIPAVS
jgi:hypothetical protein